MPRGVYIYYKLINICYNQFQYSLVNIKICGLSFYIEYIYTSRHSRLCCLSFYAVQHVQVSVIRANQNGGDMVTKTFLYFIEFIPYSLLEIVKKLVLYAILIRLLIFLNDCNIYTIIMKGYANSYSMRLNFLSAGVEFYFLSQAREHGKSKTL